MQFSYFLNVKQAAGSVAKKLDEDFSRALADPLYINIHHAMYSTDKSTEEEEQKLEANIEMNGNSETKNKHEVLCRRAIMEIEEKEEEEEEYFEECVSFEEEEEENVHGKSSGDIRRQFRISPEVEQALWTLDRVINMVRKYNTSPRR